MKKAADQVKRSKDSNLDATTAIYNAMLLGKVAGDHSIAFPEQLDRSRLDYSLESLRTIDQYLGQVRTQQDGLVGLTYLNTIVAVACYLGEVIRRGTPEGECHWLRTSPDPGDSSQTGVNLGDFADIVLGASGSGQSLRPTRMVARILNGNGEQALTYEYAVLAMQRIWVSVTATAEPGSSTPTNGFSVAAKKGQD